MNNGNAVNPQPPFPTAAPHQPVIHADASAASAAVASPVDRRRTAADRLHEDIAQGQPNRPPPQHAPTGHETLLRSFLKPRLASSFALGSVEASRLAECSKALRAEWRDQAHADKLIHALQHRPAEVGPSEWLQQIINESNDLPPALQLHVVKRVLSSWCGRLEGGAPGMESILNQLLAANARFDGIDQYEMLDMISDVFRDPRVRRQVDDPAGTAIDRTAMEAVFANFSTHLERMCRTQSRGVARRVRNHAAMLAREAARPPQVVRSLKEVQVGLLSHAQTMYSRGLYLVPDTGKRCRHWHTMMNNVASSEPPVQVELLPELISCVPDLETHAQRHDAFGRVLSAIETLPDDAQPASIAQVADVLHCVPDPVLDAGLFARLTDMAVRMPAPSKVAALIAVGEAIEGRPFHERRALFDRILDQLPTLDVDGRTDVLAMLTDHVTALPHDDWRASYDAVLRAIRATPTPLQPELAVELFTSISSMQPPTQRHLLFMDAVDFIASHPVGTRQEMVTALEQSVWSQAEDATQLQCLDSYLSLVRSLPAEQGVACLQSLYDENLVESAETLKFCIACRLFDEAGKHADAAQPMLLNSAAAQAVQIDQPYCGPIFERIARRLQTLPALLHADATQAIAAQLKEAIAGFDYDEFDPPDLPDYFTAVLDATEKLPDELRIGALVGFKASLQGCPAGWRPVATEAVAEKVNALPPALLAELLDRSATRRAD